MTKRLLVPAGSRAAVVRGWDVRGSIDLCPRAFRVGEPEARVCLGEG